MSRSLFGFDGPTEKDQAYDMFDNAPKGSYFYRLVFSNDPRKEDTFKDLNLEELTVKMMFHLEKRLQDQKRLVGEIQFVAAEHNDHTPIRHIHALVVLPDRLTAADFQDLRAAFTKASLAQRQHLDQGRGQAQQQMLTARAVPSHTFSLDGRNYSRGTRPGRTPFDSLPCPACGPGHSMVKLDTDIYFCAGCGLVLSTGVKLDRKRSQHITM
jgi:hypothetical protein